LWSIDGDIVVPSPDYSPGIAVAESIRVGTSWIKPILPERAVSSACLKNEMATPDKPVIPESQLTTMDSRGHALCKVGGVVTLILLAYSLVTMVLLMVVGGQPKTVQEGFALLQDNRLVGLLRLDVLTILVMPGYYLLFLAFFTILNKANAALSALSTLLSVAGVTLVLATPSAFSWLSLSDKFAAASSDAERAQLVAAGEAILASDLWHGSGALVGGLLLETGMLLISVVMLDGRIFRKSIAYVGILTHGLDLAHTPLGFFVPSGGVILMVIAGPLYLVWFSLLARDFFRGSVLAARYRDRLERIGIYEALP
jgi:hypothetical protein